MEKESDDIFESSDGAFIDEEDFEDFVGSEDYVKKYSVKDYLKAIYDTQYILI